MKEKLVMRECHDLETTVNRIKDLTGSLSRISINRSGGK